MKTTITKMKMSLSEINGKLDNIEKNISNFRIQQ